MLHHQEPSAHARELVRGAYDIHVHIAPDVMKRRVSDLELAPRFQQLGMAGFVLKSHYTPTAERAEVVRSVHPGVDVLGAITLNASVGGLNPVAVEIAARGGAQFVWLPTVDSDNQRSCLEETPEGATPPMWARIQEDLRDAGIVSPAVDVLDEDGEVTAATRQVIDVIAKHDMTLATGHLHGDESAKVIALARERGVRRLVVTHPEFTSQRIPAQNQRALADHGAYLERCLTTPLTGKVSWQVWLDNIRSAGPESSVISSDLGQPFNPPVEDGLALAADVLLDNGFTDQEVRLMVVHNSRRLAGADPLPDAPAAHRAEEAVSP
ncbi:hypothetical protein KGD83_17660 [Nocardiopsis akebiae]|uniref:Cytosolic protein n=1 Tax=Nocardiopsis akebiae TaxID=2831968 RepID=A0ABX8BYK7_9ACTN|nr:DUF6282 family protein [Nocardiopsis akebiae]QUX27159.1 hypothetical protein KGD83_17660 [Nocardiopsis akebiae]